MNTVSFTASQAEKNSSSKPFCNTPELQNATQANHQQLVMIYRILAISGFLLAFIVVALGAYTRLVHAGLGCPDWPGCYGHLTWPTSAAEISAAQARFPESPVQLDKTWPEMVHRYFAGTLGILILAIVALSVINKARNPSSKLPIKLPISLLIVVVIQAAFGMWTVTLKLWPQVVTLHLLGGFTTLALLGVLNLRLHQHRIIKNLACYSVDELPSQSIISRLKKVAVIALALTAIQISLGGWTAANYAALPCHDFPTCQGSYWPTMDFRAGFNIGQTIGPNYLGGQLDGPARTAIHVAHRLGALSVLCIGVVFIALLAKIKLFRHCAVLLAVVLTIQLALGISNVIFVTPLSIAVLHNMGGALLLLSILYCIFSLSTFDKANAQLIKPINP